jgi:hypothetical protein
LIQDSSAGREIGCGASHRRARTVVYRLKADKDRRQAAALIEALAERQPGALKLAAAAARKHRDKALMRDIKTSLAHIPAETRNALEL